jgi:predicted NodU family carbamoyl transferase
MKNILGINISHNCSFAYFQNNTLKEHYGEDRFNKIKNFSPDPYIPNYKYEVLEKFKNIEFDMVCFASFIRMSGLLDETIIKNILKQINYKDYFFNRSDHHIYHAMCGYYFSKFNEALCIVTDGGGERFRDSYFQCMESIFNVNKNKITTYYKSFSNKRCDFFNNFVDAEKNIKVNNMDIRLTNKNIGGLKYIHYLSLSGFKDNQEGQMMGVAAYKNKNTELNKNVLDIANKAQEETLQERIELIEKATKYNSCKNIILSGGYHLNCANNFKLVKHFPKINFFVDPICYDGGTAVGVSYYYENYI